MEISLFTSPARIVIALAAVAAGVLALALGRLRRTSPSRRLEKAFVALSLVSFTGLGILAVEKLMALAVSGAAPGGVAYNEWRWVVGAPWGRAGIAAGVVVAALTVAISYQGTLRERLPRRALLVSLRAGACAAALILFLEPAVELRHVTREPNHVAVIVDDSRSMAIGEEKGGPSRAERAAALVAASGATFERWREEHILDFFTFSDSLLGASESQLSRPMPARADATLLREALEGLRTRFDSHDLAGVVVISDGTPTGRFADGVDAGSAQDFLAGLGVKVHTAWAGRAGLRDLAIARVHADDFAFVRTAMKIEVLVRASGVGQERRWVALRRDGELVKAQPVDVGGPVPEARVVFEVVPDRVGKYVYQVEVAPLPEEPVPENNRRAFVVRVTRDKTRVLQVVGRPSWDERALRGFFKADPNVDLISFFILRTADSVNGVPTEELSLIPFPTHELFEDELGSFDVIVLQNFEFRKYGIQPYLDNIRDYVENGGGLAMIGGDGSFSSGGYFSTPVAEALPVELLPSYDDPRNLLSTEEFQPRLTEEGLRHPITQLRFDRRDNQARWAGLPRLEGLNLVAGPKPGATVLLEHPSLRTRAGKPQPLLVTGEFGKGRSLALLTDSAWRWGFVAAGREGDDGRAFEKLWENSVRWLIRDPELEYLHVEADQAEYKKGSAPRLIGRLTDKDYRPAPRQEVAFQVFPIVEQDAVRKKQSRPAVATPPAVFERAVATDDTGQAAVDSTPLAPGSYRVIARAVVGGRPVTAEDVFVVNPEREELEHPDARADVLQGIARATGGRALGTADSLPADLPFAQPRVVRVDRRSDIEVWSRPHLLLLALAFMGAEWTIRRRRGFL